MYHSNAQSCTDPVLRCGSTEIGDHGFHLLGKPAHLESSLMPVHKSQVHTGQFHTGRGDDVNYYDQPVGDWSTGSVESMEWQQHLRVDDDEEDLVVSIKLRVDGDEDVAVSINQPTEAIEEQRVNCSLALQHCFLDRVYRSQNEEQESKDLVAQMTRFEKRSSTGVAGEVSLSQEEVQRRRASEDSDEEDHLAREHRSRRVTGCSDGAQSCSGLQGGSGSIVVDSRSSGSLVRWTGSIAECSDSQEGTRRSRASEDSGCSLMVKLDARESSKQQDHVSDGAQFVNLHDGSGSTVNVDSRRSRALCVREQKDHRAVDDPFSRRRSLLVVL